MDKANINSYYQEKASNYFRKNEKNIVYWWNRRIKVPGRSDIHPTIHWQMEEDLGNAYLYLKNFPGIELYFHLCVPDM